MNEDRAISALAKQRLLRAAIEVGRKEAERGELMDANEVFAHLAKRAQQIEAAARRNTPDR